MQSEETKANNEYKGYPLFNDVEPRLRDRNRGVVLNNIFEEHQKDGKLAGQGLALLLGYFKQLPAHEKKAARQAFRDTAEKRGYLNES